MIKQKLILWLHQTVEKKKGDNVEYKWVAGVQ